MGFFTRRMPASERSVAEIEAELERSQEQHTLYLFTIRALLYCIKEFALDLTEIDAERFKERIDTLTGRFRNEEKPAQLQRILLITKTLFWHISDARKTIYATVKGSSRTLS
jgi:hypothetical protein